MLASINVTGTGNLYLSLKADTKFNFLAGNLYSPSENSPRVTREVAVNRLGARKLKSRHDHKMARGGSENQSDKSHRHIGMKRTWYPKASTYSKPE